MKNAFVCYLIIFNLIKFNNFYADICINCCETNDYKSKEKSFLDAIENNAAQYALKRLEDYLTNKKLTNHFYKLNDFIDQKKNDLYSMDNDTKLSICSETFIISELIYILHVCYYHYSRFVINNDSSNFEEFNKFFFLFLKVCDLMIDSALSNYEDYTSHNDIDKQLFNKLKSDALNDNCTISEDIINVKDTVLLRNKISDLFYKVFCKLIKKRFKKELNCENIDDENIKNIDAISF